MINMTKKIEIKDRLIVALDVPSIEQAKELVDILGDEAVFYKIGLELFMSGEYFELLEWLNSKDKKIFVDLKFFDVPATVGRAVAQLNGKGVTFATIHGNDSIMRAAAANKGDVQILAVTVLTSLDRGDLDDLGFDCDVQQLVLSRAKRAIQLGCDGVVASGHEAKAMREALGHG
ncbi:MAG: orotidine-5'-phosphate decarboxylase, partial [Arenicella sp.]